jgi:hypothetical protein
MSASIEEFNNRFTVKTKYSEELNKFFKTQPKYFYDAEYKLWSFPTERLPYIREHLESLGIDADVVDKRRYSTIGVFNDKVKLELGCHFNGFELLRELPGYKYEMGAVECDADQLENVRKIMNSYSMPMRGYDIQ